MFVRIVKVPSSSGRVHEYVRVVESYREEGRVKQRVIANLGRRDMLAQMLPQLVRLVRGDARAWESGDVQIQPVQALTWGPVLVVRALFDELGLWKILDRYLGPSKSVPFADRALVLIANRLVRPKSEHGLAGWLETDLVCDRRGRRFVPRWKKSGRVQVNHRQLQSWYRTLDRLVEAKPEIERQLYVRLRDLFSLQPDLVLYDVTSTYFEGRGPQGFAKHGYSRDDKPRNRQVIVGVVMVNGWPIAHHVFEGDRQDRHTVRQVIADLENRFSFKRIVFVGDRGMVLQENLDLLRSAGHGYVLGVQRRRSPQVMRWLGGLTDDWIDCPVGIAASERSAPPRTRVQEVPHDDPHLRVFIVDSDERNTYERSLREQAMARLRVKLEKLQRRVAAGKLKSPEKIGAAAERILRRHHGHRYYAWQLSGGAFEFHEHPIHLERETRCEGKYIIVTTEKNLSPPEAVALYKQLCDVERGFRHLKDLVGLRPIYHHTELRVRAHIFVAALALLLDRLLERRLKAAGLELSAPAALEALQTVRHVTFDTGRGRRAGVTAGSPRAQQVLKALGIRDRHPPGASDQAHNGHVVTNPESRPLTGKDLRTPMSNMG